MTSSERIMDSEDQATLSTSSPASSGIVDGTPTQPMARSPSSAGEIPMRSAKKEMLRSRTIYSFSDTRIGLGSSTQAFRYSAFGVRKSKMLLSRERKGA